MSTGIRSTSLADRVTVPHPRSWALLATVWLVLGLVIAVAAVHPRVPAVAEATAGVPGVAVTGALDVLAVLSALAAVLAARRMLYDRLADRPGPVVITSFQGTPARAVTEDILADFREVLTAMSLSSPEPVPHEPSSDGVLDDARTVFTDPKSAVSTVVSLVTSLLRVRHAYRVSVQLRTGAAGARCGMSVHVSRMPSRRGDVRTVWADDWHSAATRAAHVVGAYVIPRSRLSTRAPWRAWHGLEMPTELFHQSQRATEHLRHREYDEALAALHAALEHDPLNPHLRIQLGQAYEQLGLFLDATAVYADIVAVESWHDRRLWRRLRQLLNDDTSGPPPRRWARSPHGPDALLIARYRLVSRLAAAEQLVHQWRTGEADTAAAGSGPGNPRRAAEREALRARLRIWLRSYAVRYVLDEVDHRTDETPRQTLERLERESPQRFRHLVQYVALTETDALIDDYRWSQGRRRPGMIVSQTGLNLLRIWARLYTDDATADLGRRPGRWPKSPERLDLEIARYLMLKPARTRSWKEYYNAACVVAVALRGWTGDDATARRQRHKLALQAVRHLERAVTTTDSGYVGRYAQWLSAGDPDLNPLRATPEFHDFLARHLPDRGTRIVTPEDRLLPLVISHHVLRVMAGFCRARAGTWRAGGPGDGSDAAAHRDEAVALALAGDYVRNPRHWPTRAALIGAARAAAAAGDRPAPTSALPHPGDDPVLRRRSGDTGGRDDRATPADGPEHVLVTTVMDARDAVWVVLDDRIATAEHLPVASGSAIEHAVAAAFWDDLAHELERAIGVPTTDRPRP
ncbi:hypothetical protein GCM10023200_34700 [Actinomycetospora chlora]|uniref:Tetratricopeptide repeat protein n=1 Tax=Actinomycetospora chlora TaxID=663608 RepID=A0ABP9BLR4_9PSEU